MRRVLDIDLDFFVSDVAYARDSAGERLPEPEFQPWDLDDVLWFLEVRCRLTGPLPGWVVEHHAEAFPLWRSAVRSGVLSTPFHVTHVDAHADLGNGDYGFRHLITELMHRPVAERDEPKVGFAGLNDGSWLSFAVACGWVGDLTYVFPDNGGEDVLRFHVAPDGVNLQMKAATEEMLADALYSRDPLVGVAADQTVPFRQVHHNDWSAPKGEPFDGITLCRSPGFTPASSDRIFEEIRRRFVDEFASPGT